MSTVYHPNDDAVILDGVQGRRDWPLALAEQLLADPMPWSAGASETGRTQWSRFAEVASSVNWSTRRHVSPKVAVERLGQNDRLESYSTQELLDMLSAVWRMQRHVGYGLTEIEPGLRTVVRIVVTRVRSATPPQFQPPR